jgi:CheY-like chemotaxis protein/Tfp pilus assembly protein PilF
VNLANKTILVIDDYQNMRATLRQMLLALGYRKITMAATGEEALDILRLRRHDIILCDYNLGRGLDGQQMLDLARQDGLIDLATVFVMITAENSTDMVIGALESMPDAYISKPFTKDLLKVRLERALKRREPLSGVAQVLAQDGPQAALLVLKHTLTAIADDIRPELLRIQAELALKIDDLVLAEAACREAMAKQPVAWALTLLAQVAEKRQFNPRIAESLYRRAIALTPHYMEAHDRLAALCEMQDRHDEALEILHAAAQRSPKSLTRQRRLARLAQFLDRPEIAEPAWRRVLTISNQIGEPKAADHFGEVLTLLALGDIHLARQRSVEIARNCRQDPQAHWWMLAARLRCLGNNDGAIKATLLEQLDTQLAVAKPPDEPAAALDAVLRAMGEVALANNLRRGGQGEHIGLQYGTGDQYP